MPREYISRYTRTKFYRHVGSGYNFVFTCGSVFTFWWSESTHSTSSSARLISALSSANRFPICDTSQTTRISVFTGKGRKYVTFRLRLTPAYWKTPGFPTAITTMDVNISIMVAAHPPCKFPSALLIDGVTSNLNVARTGGPWVADSMRTLASTGSMFHLFRVTISVWCFFSLSLSPLPQVPGFFSTTHTLVVVPVKDMLGQVLQTALKLIQLLWRGRASRFAHFWSAIGLQNCFDFGWISV